MAATRKLQGEIDRCLKKVTEGVETFEDIWQKVHNATNSNQKEKYEADLKKEIKKLQRLRDQIKSWIASAEIKDKNALLDNRRLIETQMERFKVVERETKTKAYSKEGLGAAQKLDPIQRVKEETSTWLTASISNLQIQIDQYESEIESLLAGKKKRLDKDKQDRMDELRAKLDRHKFHITKLETILRLLDNDGVEVEQIRKIKDDVEYYIESSQDPDFEENEYIYDDITGLDEVELSGTGIASSATTDSNNSNDTGGSPSSMTSGTSPTQSPALNCSTATTHNHSTDSAAAEFAAVGEKRPKEVTKVTPVKPTAVRMGKIDLNSSAAPAGVVTTLSAVASSVANSSAVLNSSTTVAAQLKDGAQPQSKIVCSTPSKNHQLPQSSLVSSVSLSSSLPATVPSTPSMAFAVVAKHNTSLVENGPVHQMPSYSTATSSTSLLSGLNSQQQSQVTNIPQNQSISSTGSVAPPQIPNSNLIHANATVASASEGVFTSSTVSSNSNSTLTNCVSPSHSVVSSRASPGLLSPQQQMVNGPSMNLKNAPVSANSLAASVAAVADSMSTLKTMAQEAISRAGLSTVSQSAVSVTGNMSSGGGAIAPTVTTSAVGQSAVTPVILPQQQQQLYVDSMSAVATNGPNTNATSIVASSIKNSGTNEAHIPPLLGVAPLGPSPLQKEHQLQFQMMEAAFYHLPTPSDSERLRTYQQRQPVPTPLHYPQNQLPHSDTVEFFQRLSPETLFFVFYYMEGTKAQYLAAKALKKQSWRFHTKYMMWFQRHEEPKIINEEYEQGTYIYFDYEKWGQRKKEGFTFEYKYLEDRDLN
ncbi:CCR4-NOT transcription complex subunit 3 [Phlebotomus argentipes]|uniref:CCR4-NOT transcription complex subunit 3 n=1 Tax=Phlebotomus argentipes TaxID=94469 RepID=UPI002892A98B|nr:CCR4-NOT transcription complex subunit 3 [Phlebotomus argentipes]